MAVPLPLSGAVPVLLDATDSLLRARQLRSWRNAQKERVHQRLVTLHREWISEWIRDGENVSEALMLEVAEPRGTMAAISEDAACWSFVPPPHHANSIDLPVQESLDPADSVVRAIAKKMFAFDMGAMPLATQAPATVAPAVAKAAWLDWLRRLNDLLAGFKLEWRVPTRTDERGGHAPADPWSGTLRASWSWCGGVWQLGLPYGAVAALLGDEVGVQPKPLSAAEPAGSSPQVSLDQALAAQHMVLRVILDGARLNLGQLQALRIGDIVPLDHALEAPAHVTSAGGVGICDGWLGQSDGSIAIELTATDPRAALARLNIRHSNERTP